MIPHEAKLLDLLSNHDVTFFIPPYQRNYEWTEEQCRVFLEDLFKTFEHNSNENIDEHFFGTITFFKTETAFGEPSKLILIDGQQRITTTMLFLIAIRNIEEDSKTKDFIDSKYLKNDSISSDTEYKIKLKQVETDWIAYKNLVLNEKSEKSDRNTAIYKNYNFFFNYLTNEKNKGILLTNLINLGLNKFSIITIELEPHKNPWENPQEIFESMNSLGKPLSLADLVRNYLLLGLNPETQEKLYKKYWLLIEKTIPGQVSNFIRDYMQAVGKRFYKQATEANFKELYGQFKTNFAGQDSEELLSALATLSTIYSYIITDNSTGSIQLDNILADLRRLSSTTANSFLMMLLKSWRTGRFTTKDILDILEVFNIYCLRRRITAITSGENKYFPTLINYIPDLESASDKKKKMFDILSS